MDALNGSQAHTPPIPGGYMVSWRVSQTLPLTSIPKRLFHTKWPSPGPSLAGMGGGVPEGSAAVHNSTGRAHTHTCTNTTQILMCTQCQPASRPEPQALPRGPGLQEGWGDRQPLLEPGLAGPKTVAPLLLGVHCAKESRARNVQSITGTHLLLQLRATDGVRLPWGRGSHRCRQSQGRLRAPGAGGQLSSA